MYHHIWDKKWNEPMYVSRDEFSRQIKYLRDNKYRFLSMEEVEEYKLRKRKFPRRAVAITFDDGYEDVYRNAYPILRENGANGTVFVTTSKLDEKGYLSKNQILEMQGSRVIKSESHTDNHLQLPRLNYEDQFRELTDSKDKLERVLEDFKYFTHECRVSRVSDIKIYLKRIKNTVMNPKNVKLTSKNLCNIGIEK
jgi:peptidoglycan/xylan/chitin deacetylase (PgdA/CDA1 family)